jgi:hypothetical protein
MTLKHKYGTSNSLKLCTINVLKLYFSELSKYPEIKKTKANEKDI